MKLLRYDFDNVLNRQGTLSYKWDVRNKVFPDNPQVLPLWAADMDFRCPKEISDAIQERAAHQIYGYSLIEDDFGHLVADWQKKRNGWTVKPEWIAFYNGVIPSLNAIVTAFTKEGDGIIIQPPVYYQFNRAIVNNNRVVIENELLYNGSRWSIDFDGLERLARKTENKLLMLCNPHNPVSRAFEKEELLKIGEICLKNQVLIVSDEIHSDLVYRHCKHVPIASLNNEISDITLTAVSITKTFNIAGLPISSIITSNSDLLEKFKTETERRSYMPNLFGSVALRAAYTSEGCAEYLEQLIDYLWENYLFIDQYLNTYVPKIKCQRPEATYLLWLDCSELELEPEQIERFFVQEAGVGLENGLWFGRKTGKYMRINIACSRSVLKACMEQIRSAYEKRKF
jgi:cystathionine beta-lyase